MMRF